MHTDFFFVYVLFSFKDHKLYIGFTENLDNRFSEHSRGKVTATKDRRPLDLIYFEGFRNKKDAKSRERFLKSGFGRSQLKKALQNDLENLGYKYRS